VRQRCAAPTTARLPGSRAAIINPPFLSPLVLQGTQTTALEFIQSSAPIKVHGLVVASNGGDEPGLGSPVEYIDLRGTTLEAPAVCKYSGNKFYSDSWFEGGAH
jgi:NADH dehydrogenase (ubiquinone) Fe-S protein 6